MSLAPALPAFTPAPDVDDHDGVYVPASTLECLQIARHAIDRMIALGTATPAALEPVRDDITELVVTAVPAAEYVEAGVDA